MTSTKQSEINLPTLFFCLFSLSQSNRDPFEKCRVRSFIPAGWFLWAGAGIFFGEAGRAILCVTVLFCTCGRWLVCVQKERRILRLFPIKQTEVWGGVQRQTNCAQEFLFLIGSLEPLISKYWASFERVRVWVQGAFEKIPALKVFSIMQHKIPRNLAMLTKELVLHGGLYAYRYGWATTSEASFSTE